MRHFLILLKHELRMLLINPATYIAAVLFLTLMGYVYWFIITDMILKPEDAHPTTSYYRFFWFPVFFVVPLLTMRSVAGERASGTLESLMTTPSSRAAVVGSKFMGAYLFYLLLWMLAMGFPWILEQSFPRALSGGSILDGAPLFGGFFFVATSGVLFIAIGIFASCLTRSQLVAGLLTFTALFIVIVGGQQIGIQAGQNAGWTDSLGGLVDYLQIIDHLKDFSNGIVDTRPFFYYTSTGLLLLGLATLVIEAKA